MVHSQKHEVVFNPNWVVSQPTPGYILDLTRAGLIQPNKLGQLIHPTIWGVPTTLGSSFNPNKGTHRPPCWVIETQFGLFSLFNLPHWVVHLTQIRVHIDHLVGLFKPNLGCLVYLTYHIG